MPEPRVQTKSAKVLINKKLASDTPPPSAAEQQAPKKKAAWNIDKDSQRQFSGRADDDCTICCDPMTSTSAYQVACGHAFHENVSTYFQGNKITTKVFFLHLINLLFKHFSASASG